jgi:hypothetical protein
MNWATFKSLFDFGKDEGAQRNGENFGLIFAQTFLFYISFKQFPNMV